MHDGSVVFDGVGTRPHSYKSLCLRGFLADLPLARVVPKGDRQAGGFQAHHVKENAMANNLVSNERRLSPSAKVAVCMTAAAALTWFGLSTGAQERTAQSLETPAPAATPADLESAFWLCDYIGTTQSVDSGAGVACSVITEELKNKNFGGDFDAMVAWWREKKPAEHQRLEAASRANAPMETATTGGKALY
jgi:hypothetical protein